MQKRRRPARDMRAFLLFFLVVLLLIGALAFAMTRLVGGCAPPADVRALEAVAPTSTKEPIAEEPTTAAPTPSKEAATEAPTAEPTPEAAPEPLFTPRTATIRALGDLMMHSEQLKLARRPGGKYDFHSQYALIRESLECADYTIANLETTVGLYSDKPYSGYPLFNAPEALLEAVKDSGIDFLTLANNHMLDRYFDGMVQTVNLVEKHGFDFGGANRSQAEMDAPNVVEVNGIKLGMLCYTQHTNGMDEHSDARATRYGINYLKNADFAADVRKLRGAGAEVVIAMVHWGREYKRSPNAYQKNMAKRMAEAGVDVILGSHPHVVQPAGLVDVPDGKGGTRRMLVAFSLGNFNSFMSASYTDSGVILEFTLTERESGGFDIGGLGFVPTYCWRHSDAVQTLSSAKYYDNPPAGMSAGRASKMRESGRDLAELMGKEVTVLEK